MSSKLTLSVEKNVIERAKHFSRKQHKSLSKLVEGYLRDITRTSADGGDITNKVAALSGVIPAVAVRKGKKKGYADYLADKYR
ncbi:MAG: hypothetical protein HY896_10885 [Deltaproteobacteria bacterium]|nr:hypothetical protein [Deltaproteobacteria bacterium]